MKYEGRSYQWRQVLTRLGFTGSLKERSTGVIVTHCPFLNEKTPSMHFYPQSMRARCYGCGVNEEVTGFVALYKGYKDAIPEDMRELQEFFAKLT